MALSFVSRTDYRKLRHYQQHDSLAKLEPDSYWLPEGGALDLALQGVGEIISEIAINYDHLICACGTGTTLAGLIAAAPDSVKILGISALKAEYLTEEVKRLLTQQGLEKNNWQINQNYHFGGFAKYTPELINFMQHFNQQQGVPLEPSYTGKVLYAVYDLLKQGYFKPGERIIMLHTGGLQAWRHLAELSQ